MLQNRKKLSRFAVTGNTSVRRARRKRGILLKKEYAQAKQNIILGVLSDLFAVGYFWETFHFGLRDIPNSVNAAFFPRLIACLVAVCATVILVRGIREMGKVSPEERKTFREEDKANLSGLVRIGEVFIVLLLVAITFKKLGFLLTAPWMMFALFVILEAKDKRNYLLYAALSIVAPVVVFLMFYYGFSTMLPMGFLRPYLLQILV